MSSISKNYKNIINEIKKYEKDFCKTSENVKLIAVSKTFPKENIEKIIRLGQRIFGENKVQEAALKWPQLKQQFNNIELHLIGGLQSNKVKLALDTFDVIQTIDREKVVLKIKDYYQKSENCKNHKFFVQVNTGNELQKNGLEITKTKEFVKWCVGDNKLNVVGLMCIPPVEENSSIHFKTLRSLANDCALTDLSMGMSGDFVEAIKNGATHVRIGSGIFGQRA
tara:strand:+ start:46 stop:717 length:672 start_codon:yes stop_codon:yes gene_type:complete